MKIDAHKITLWLGIFIPFWSAIVFLWTFNESLARVADLPVMANYVTKSDSAVTDLDARLERTEILVALYGRNPESLTPDEANRNERAKARLINLETQRDNLLRISHD
jgi:hypothetical protein